MPKLGNSVESSIIVTWRKHAGDKVVKGDVLCEVETDKSVLEVTAPESGTLLATFRAEGDDVPVLTVIAAIGKPGEDVSALATSGVMPPSAPTTSPASPPQFTMNMLPTAAPKTNGHKPVTPQTVREDVRISPRARGLAAKQGIDPTALAGSGPEGRIIARDIQAAQQGHEPLTPLAKDQAAGRDVPASGSGPGGRITAADLHTAAQPVPQPQPSPDEIIPIKGVRKVIAERMVGSLQGSAQLTLNRTADARALLEYRKRLKVSSESLGLHGISVNDLLLFAVARTLPAFPDLNSTLEGGAIHRHRAVHLAFAVDTARGLLVPVLRNAASLSLRALAVEANRLVQGAQAGNLPPEALNGGTFTVTNLGSLGIESFTPIINPPQVAILGVGSINLKPVAVANEVKFFPHLALSLTIDHQVVDGAPGARFLAAVADALTSIDLLSAV